MAARHIERVRRGDELTVRERQVLAGAAEGKSNDEIAGDLYVSLDTVRAHMKSLLRKLGARNRTHAVGIGCAAGLLTATAKESVS